MIGAKIKLSEDEMQLVQNPDIILTKNAIIQKVMSLFGLLSEEMKLELGNLAINEEWAKNTPRISKGENYLGLPYVILDYPRLFSNENILAIRVFFWWGHYFSVNLHLSGGQKEKFSKAIQKNWGLLKNENFNICISNEEWRHELAEDNYTSISNLTEEEMQNLIFSKPFIKLSAKTDFSEWDTVANRLMGSYKTVLKVLRQEY